jgi:hypothetical protein
MAVVEEVKIKFTTDTSELKSSKQELQDLGVIAEKDATAFDKITESANAATSSIKNVGKGTSEELNKVATSSTKAANAIKATGTNANAASKNFQTLRQQISQARADLDRLTIAYGKNSAQVAAQKLKLAQLKDEYKDLNRQISFLNPEDKIRAFQAFGSGVFSAIQVATGAMQTFNTTSEELDRAINRISGVVSAIYGLTSFIQLKEQFEDIGSIFKTTAAASEIAASTISTASDVTADFASTASDVVTTTKDAASTLKTYSDATKAVKETAGDVKKAIDAQSTAQKLNTVAQEVATGAVTAQDTATKAATVSTRAFTTALLSSPLGLIAVGIGAVVGALFLYEKATAKSKAEAQRLLDVEAGLLAARGQEKDALRALAISRGEISQANADITGNTEQFEKDNDQLGKEIIKQIDLVKEAEKEYNDTLNKIQEAKKRTGKDTELTEEEKRYLEKTSAAKNLKTQNKILLDLENTFQSNLNALEAKNTVIRIASKKEEDDANKLAREQAKAEEERLAAEQLRIKEDFIQSLLSKIEEEKKIRLDAIDVKRLQGADDKQIITDQLTSIKLERESLQAILEKTKGTRFYAELQQRINQLQRDELKTQAELTNLNTQKELQLIEKRAKSRNDEINLLQQIGTKESDILKYRLQSNIENVADLQTLLLLTTNAKDRADIENKINELLLERKGINIQIPQATGNEEKAKLQETINAINAQKDRELVNNEIRANSRKELAEANLKTDIYYLELEIAERKKAGEQVAKLEADLNLMRKKLRGEDLDSVEQTEEEKRKILEFTLSNANDLIGASTEYQSVLYEREIAEAEDLKNRKLITEEEYQRRVNIIKNKQYEAEKRAQIAQAIINTAQGIINATTIQPASLIPWAIATVTALGAFNVAKIQATPIPKFKKGTLSVGGVDTGKDSVMAMLRPGEAVIPVETKRDYYPAIKAIYQKQIKPSDINNYVMGKLTSKGVSITNTKSNNSKSNIDTYTLGKIISKNKSFEITNVDYLAKAIARELSNNYSARR